MDTLFTISHCPEAESPEAAIQIPVTLAEGEHVVGLATIGLVQAAMRDQRVLQITLDAAVALVANADHSDQMLRMFEQQVEKTRQLTVQPAQNLS